MRLRQLQTLVAIADCGNFVRAAERLSMTQSAVSMQMKSLEKAFQAQVFDRSIRPPVLTASGRLLVARAREIVSLYEGLREVYTVDGELSGLLRLGAIPGITVRILPQTLANLRRKHSKLQIKVETGLSDALTWRVTHGTLDAAIVTEPTRFDNNLVWRTVTDEKLCVIAHIDETGATERQLLSTLPYVAFNRRSQLGRLIEESLRVRKVAVQHAMELDSMEAILLMVSRGLGVAVVPEASITCEFERTVCRQPFGEPPLRHRVCLIQRTGQRHAAAADALYRELLKAAPKGTPAGNVHHGPPTTLAGDATQE